MALGKGLGLGVGLSLRPYATGGDVGAADPQFGSVTVLYGFEDANFASGVNNEGSLADGTVQASGVVPSTAQFKSGAKSAAFNQTGASSNNGITMGATTSVLGLGAFTIEGWIRDPAAAFFQLFSCGVDGDSSNRLNIDFLSTRTVSCVFGSSITRNSATAVWPADQFFHFAFVFESTPAFRCYVDGTQVLSGTDGFGRSGNAHLARHNITSTPVSGPAFLDELRISTVARYTGTSFTVPAAPFPRS